MPFPELLNAESCNLSIAECSTDCSAVVVQCSALLLQCWLILSNADMLSTTQYSLTTSKLQSTSLSAECSESSGGRRSLADRGRFSRRRSRSGIYPLSVHSYSVRASLTLFTTNRNHKTTHYEQGEASRNVFLSPVWLIEWAKPWFL